MKTRNGFVSNSSSSSFVCEVCGTLESGWDAGPSDFDMIECNNRKYEHCLCEKHIVVPDDKDLHEDCIDDDDDWCGTALRAEFCPLCNFDVIDPKAASKYLLVKQGTTIEELTTEIKSKFSSLTELNEFLYPKKKDSK